MKKLIVIFVLAFVAFVSCKQFDFGESQEDGKYGTVVFDLTDRLNARAAGEYGLPNINNSRMNITIAVDGQREETIPFSKDARKQYKGVFLVGTKVRFGVALLTKSGKWKGSSEITVASGTNNLSVRLKKAVAELEPLKFRLIKDGIDSQGNPIIKFELGFFGEEIPFFNETVSGDYKNKAPSFCRDSKGRTYIFYVDSDDITTANKILRRYTNEGVLETSFSYKEAASQVSGLFVVSDYKTGKVFVSYDQGGGNREFYLVEEGDPDKGTHTELKSITLDTSSSISDMKLMGVYDGVFAFVDKEPSEYKIKLYRYEEGSTISLKAMKEESLGNDFLKVDIKAANTGMLIGEFVDCFMNDKSVYLLYKYEKNQSSFGISTGGIAKCDYAVQDETVSIKDVERLIGDTEYVADARNIVSLEDEKREFYGPQRFMGFEKRKFVYQRRAFQS